MGYIIYHGNSNIPLHESCKTEESRFHKEVREDLSPPGCDTASSNSHA